MTRTAERIEESNRLWKAVFSWKRPERGRVMICKGLMPFASAQQALGYAILSDAAAFTCFVADDQAGGWVTVRIEPRCAVVKRPGLRIATGGWVALHIEPRRAVVKRPGWRTATVAPEYFMDFGELIPFPARPGWDPF